VAGVQLINALQTIISRNLNPLEAGVLTVGQFKGGTRTNIIAEVATIFGTVRTFKEVDHRMIHMRMKEITQGIELVSGCAINLKLVDMYPPVINNLKLYEIFSGLSHDQTPLLSHKLMIAEDFAFYQKTVPGLFILLGSENYEKGFTWNLHTSKFSFDESILCRGLETSLMLINYEGNY
jgi:metal-dependent amidase/aminoacylase/carboxypeptidase family protein